MGVSPRRLLGKKDEHAPVVGVPAFLVQPHIREGRLAPFRAETAKDLREDVHAQLPDPFPAGEGDPVGTGSGAR